MGTGGGRDIAEWGQVTWPLYMTSGDVSIGVVLMETISSTKQYTPTVGSMRSNMVVDFVE